MKRSPAERPRRQGDIERGDALSREEKHAEAEACFREALRHRPNDPEAHRGLGDVLARAGRRDEAIEAFRAALSRRPEYPEAQNGLANALRDADRLEEAEAAHREALKGRPDWPEAHNDLGLTLTARGKLEEAAEALGEALRLRPGYAEALNNLGIAQVRLGRSPAAEASFRQATRLSPGFAEAHNNLGNVLGSLGRVDDAVASYREAIRLRPGYAKAHHNLGNALARLGRRDEADASYLESLRIKPGDASVLNDRGIALNDGNRFEEALECYQEALRQRPEYPEALNNMGNTLRQLDRLDESLARLDEALRLRPDYPEAHNNRGISLSNMGRLEDAVASYTRALAMRPDDAYTHLNRALAWLRLGRYELGWPEYEWRWRRRETPPPTFAQPAWNGAPLKGRTILVYTEQGSGDTLQFVRYLPLVAARGGRVVLHCPGGFIPLLSRCAGVDRLAPRESPPPDFDVHAALMSLPGLFHTEVETIPGQAPYLFADEELAGDWRRRLAGVSGFRVGVVWQGNPKFSNDLARSFPLRALAPLAAVEGVTLVSLQVENGLDQLGQVDFPVLDLGKELVRTPGMFMDAAAAVRNLDLVIACDTAMAHLAGGMGVPVWVGVPYSCDWRWLVGRVDSPWYPTLRVFRQPWHGDWDGLFRRMAGELEARLASVRERDGGRSPRRRARKPKPVLVASRNGRGPARPRSGSAPRRSS